MGRGEVAYSRTESPHRPNDNTARRGDDTDPCEQPAVANGVEQRLRDDGAHAGEDVPDEVVHRDAVGCLLGHELRQHGRRHAEDEHRADAEEEVRNQRHEPEDALFGRPPVPDERGRVQEGGDPGVLAHPVFGYVHQVALFVLPVCTLGFSGHDPVRPLAAEEGSEDVADGVGDVTQADEGFGEIVGRIGEGGLKGDIEEIERAERNTGVVDGD